jgi:hypothetical protein
VRGGEVIWRGPEAECVGNARDREVVHLEGKNVSLDRLQK